MTALQRDIDFENLNKNLEELNNKAETSITTFTAACKNFSKLFKDLEKSQKGHRIFMLILTIMIVICTIFYTSATIKSANLLKKSNQIKLKLLEIETSRTKEK